MKLLIPIALSSGFGTELADAKSTLAISPALSARVVVADFVPSVIVTTFVSGSTVTVTVVYLSCSTAAASSPSVAVLDVYKRQILIYL